MTATPGQHQSWDAFWGEVERAEADKRGVPSTEEIRGITVVVPHDLPLRFQRRMEVVQQQEREARARAMELRAQLTDLAARRDAGEDVTDELTALSEDTSGSADEAEAMENTRGLLADLFGRDVLDTWVDNGMRQKELQVLLLWGMANGNGQVMTFQQAYEAYLQAEAAGAAVGKAPEGASPAGRNSPSVKKKRPAATGGRSNRTSTRSTVSNRRTSLT